MGLRVCSLALPVCLYASSVGLPGLFLLSAGSLVCACVRVCVCLLAQARRAVSLQTRRELSLDDMRAIRSVLYPLQ